MKENRDDKVLSIVVTFCDQDKYIEQTLESLLRLFTLKFTYKFEFVVGLDKPSNQAKILANKLQSPFIRFFFLNSKENLIPFSRASENRKYLLEQAVGTYAMILDGDDYYIDVPQEAIEILEKRKEISAVQYNYKVLNEKKKEVVDNPSPFSNKEEVTLQRYIYSGKYFHLHCSVFRRNESLTLNESLYFNDGTLQQFLLTKGKFLFLTKNIMMYRVGIASIYASQVDALKKLQNSIMYEELYRTILEGKENRRLAFIKYNAFVRWIKISDLKWESNKPIPDFYYYQIKKRGLNYSRFLLLLCSLKNEKVKKTLLFVFKMYLKMKLKIAF